MFLTEHAIKLIEEDLTLTPDRDGEYYDVRAVYRLQNDGDQARLKYGVPVVRNRHGLHRTKKPREILEQSRASIQVEVAGLRSGCDPQTTPTQAPPSPGSRFDGWTEDDLVLGWCVADIIVPKGDFDLILTYRSQLEHYDGQNSKQSFILHSERVIQYPLFPATYWRGTPERITVQVHRTFDYELKLIEPKGVPLKVKGNVTTFELTAKQFKATPFLVIELDADALAQREVLRQNETIRAKATASSTLAPQGKFRYDAQNLVDGTRGTAWCEGVEGDGVGEWVELRFTPTGIGFSGIAFLPGYASSRSALEANGFPKTVRVSNCADPSVYIDYKLGPRHKRPTRSLKTYYISTGFVDDDTPEMRARYAFMIAFFMAQPEEPDSGEWGEACIRVEIREVHPGAKHSDTCISEIVPFSSD